jgi:hypothetical protein
MGLVTARQGYAHPPSEGACTLATLNGVYVFDASGYNITPLGPQPKAVVEFIDLKGDGTLTSVGTTSVNGKINPKHAGSGTYTVNEDCTGTLTFNPQGPHFDIFIAIAPDGKQFHMIQTDSNTVLAGVAQRVSE